MRPSEWCKSTPNLSIAMTIGNKIEKCDRFAQRWTTFCSMSKVHGAISCLYVNIACHLRGGLKIHVYRHFRSKRVRSCRVKQKKILHVKPRSTIYYSSYRDEPDLWHSNLEVTSKCDFFFKNCLLINEEIIAICYNYCI